MAVSKGVDRLIQRGAERGIRGAIRRVGRRLHGTDFQEQIPDGGTRAHRLEIGQRRAVRVPSKSSANFVLVDETVTIPVSATVVLKMTAAHDKSRRGSGASGRVR